MKHLLKNSDEVSSRLIQPNYILLLSDFDGTLCPIVAHPDLVSVDKKISNELKKIKGLLDVSLGIVSGRPIKELRRYLSLRGIYYAGNHGFEISYPLKSGKIKLYVQPRAKEAVSLLREIAAKINKAIAGIEGAFIENKKYTLSLHYRMATPKDQKKIKTIFQSVIKPYRRQVRITRGKKVIELRPPVNWHKGKAVRKIKELLKRKDACTVYLGDDVTDEDAFRELSPRDIGIYVGKNKRTSSADYRLTDVKEVLDFLRFLYILRKNKIEEKNR